MTAPFLYSGQLSLAVSIRYLINITRAMLWAMGLASHAWSLLSAHISGKWIKILRTRLQSCCNSTSSICQRSWGQQIKTTSKTWDKHSSPLVFFFFFKMSKCEFFASSSPWELSKSNQWSPPSVIKISFAKLWFVLLLSFSVHAESHATWCDGFSWIADDWAWCKNCWVTFYDSCYAGGQTRWS